MASTDTAAGFAGLLIEPAAILALPPARQAILIRRARLAGLLGVLGHRAEQAGLFPQCSAQLRDHFVAGQNVARDYERMLRLETRELYRFLGRLDFPLVYLKGAAYQLRGLPIARGRVASDVDILVPAPALEAAERTLLRNGWVADKSDDYDQRYYREWMHELPPLRHHARLSVVDLHHNILPRTSRFSPDAGRMLARIEPAGEPQRCGRDSGGEAGFRVASSGDPAGCGTHWRRQRPSAAAWSRNGWPPARRCSGRRGIRIEVAADSRFP